MSSFFNESQIQNIRQAALEAGEIAVKFFLEKNFQIKKKSDHSQVTCADLAVSEFLRKKLSAEFPQIPIVCEEGNLREVDDIFFLIDPIDGTSSFISGDVEFCVNIALVKNKKPIFGLIYAPLFEGGKMVFSDEEGRVKTCSLSKTYSSSLTRSVEDLMSSGSEVKLARSSNPVDSRMTGLRIITSPRSKEEDIKNYIAKFHPNFLENFSVQRVASAIKFLKICDNHADLYLHFRQSMEWDTAAGQALVELAGGKVKKLFCNRGEFFLSEEMNYKKENFLNPSFICHG